MVLLEEEAGADFHERELVESINSRTKRIFYHEDFDDPGKTRNIIGPIPSMESYLENRRQVQGQRDNPNLPQFLRPCYDEPLLSREQELHLFRRYNYHKHRAKCRLHSNMLAAAAAEIKLADSVRKTLTSANVRLAIPLVKRYRSQRHFEDLVSESFFLILRAVDYFDWTRGFKFSTYATWSIHRTMGRTAHLMMRHDSRYTFGEDGFENSIVSGSSGYEDEQRVATLKVSLSEMLDFCRPREKDVLIRRFFEEKTLEVVGDELGITKERVRQIQNQALERIREAADERNICFESF